MAWRMTFWEDRPRGILPPRISEGRVEISLPARNAVSNSVMDLVGVELVEDMVYLVVELEWRARGEFGGVNLNLPGRVHATGSLHLSEGGWRTFGIALASGEDPVRMFEGAWQITWREGFEFADPERDDVTAEVKVTAAGVFELPNEVGITKATMAARRERMERQPRVRMERQPQLGKMATEEETNNRKSEGEPGLGASAAQSERGQKDRESTNPDGTKGNRKEISTGESSGKAGGSWQGTPETKEGRNKDRTSPRSSEGAMSKKVRVTDARHKLANIKRRTAENEARLMEEMMTGNEEGPLQEVPRDERKTRGGTRQGDKGSDRGGTPSKRRKERENSSGMEAEKATTPSAIDSRASRLPTTPAVSRGCEGLWSLRERVLGWFDPEGTAKTRGPDTSMAGEASSSEGGLRKIVSSLIRALNKNQGYLADAKKKQTFDGANITEFLIDFENLVALLKWIEEEKMDHLGQHVSLSLGRDIMAIVAASRSWKETRDVMMRKYLAAEKMATEADLAALRRKNFATYNDFLREFTLVALRIPGVTDRIMSKYFLRQFSEFDKDKILSAYQQTSKFVNTRDVDFSTVTDLAEKTVVTETLALLKEGEIIDLTGRTSDKVKKGIESQHERVHGVDNTIERMEGALLVVQAQVSRPALPPQEAVVPPGVANQGFRRKDPANEQCKSLKGEIFGPQGERVNWNSPGGMRRAIIMFNGLEITAVEAEPVGEIIWDQLRGRGPQANFILENDGRDRVNATTRLGTAGRRINRDTIMEEVAGSSEPQAEPEAEEPEKVYGKPREEEPADKVTAAKKKFRYQIPILTLPELDDTISKLLGTMVSVSFQTMLQASPRLLKGLRQLLTQRRVEIDDNPELPEGEREEEAPQEVANLQRSHGDLEDLEKAFADIRLSLPDREGGEVMRSPLETKLSFHALPVGKLKIQIGTPHTDALVDGGAEITLIRRDFATITGCTVNKEVTGSIRGAGGEIPFAGYVTKCAVKAGVRESIWSFQRMTVMEEMDHDIILGRPWCANVEMIGMHLHGGSYMVDIEDPVTGRGELLRLLGTGGDPPKGKLATWSPSFEDSTRKGAFARMEGMRERVKIMIEEAFNKKEWIKMGLPQKKRRQEDEVLGVMVAEKESEVELGASLPKRKEVRIDVPEIALEIPELLQLIKALRYHKVGVDSAALAKFEREVQKGYCLNGKLVSIQPRVVEATGAIPTVHFLGERSRKEVFESAQEKDETEVQPGIRRFVWEHLQDIKDLLRRFLVYNITASGPKSILAVPEVTMLGFRCGAYGRKPNPAKTDKISQWPTPLRTTTEVRAFLGVVGFWRIFIKNFAKIVEPIRAMIREEGTMDWTEEREGVVQRLKDILTSETVALSAPCFNDKVGRPFILEMDGGPLAVGGVLIQRDEGEKERPIRFESRTLKSTEQRYSQFKTEVLAILHCLKTFQAYLFGRRFILRIDPTNVDECRRGSKELQAYGSDDREMGRIHLAVRLQDRTDCWNPQQGRWAEYILDARDNLNGFVEAVALKKKTGRSVADWIEDFYLRHPFVRRFIADNGTEFVNQEVLGMLKRLCIPIKLIEPYHPEANAPVERGH
ncbi:hypothetical protein CBR_g674 [Chara braunii]|uniref:Integrase catalytic domain-containing protein n=1 Tax=Chara braunii TaxID=69332 RepID=A0A388KC71_CHABU|nr:hypothetical protein CBR_g674 [Chara braunii]|eukprot:GBG67543.1 hypothetical protein CBR_g674 [Chara braunii]